MTGQLLYKLREVFKLSFFHKPLSKKQALFILAPFIFFGLFGTLYTATAVEPISLGVVALGAIFGIIGSWIAAAGIALGIIALMIGLSLALMLEAHVFLNWAVSSPFNMAMTNPNGNIIIELGWTLMRDFTNMLFILGLAYIGLATALDIAGFDTKKTFVNLLLIALLINFTPVICGAIVDISNIITNFFTEGINFQAMLGAVGKGFQNISWWQRMKAAVFDAPSTWAKIGLALAFTFFTGLTLLTFGGLFFLRHIVIWLLVIFSPLAFFAWIFAKTRKWFSFWWKQFITWSFIAVPAGFFLYLANHLIKEAGDRAIVTQMVLDESEGFFNALAPSIVVVSFLMAGFYATRKFTPMGAGAVIGLVGKLRGKGIGFAKKYGKKLGGWAVGVAGGGALGAAESTAEKAQEAWAGAAGRRGGRARQLVSGLRGGAVGAVGGWASGVRGPGAAKFKRKAYESAEALHLTKRGTAEKMEAKRYALEAAEKEVKKMPTARLEAGLYTWAATDQAKGRQVAMAKVLAERKKLRADPKTLAKIKQLQSLIPNFDTDDITDVIPKWTAELNKNKVEKQLTSLFGAGVTSKTAAPTQLARAKTEVNADTIRDMTPRKFRDVQFKDLGEEITTVDAAKINDIGRNAKKSEKIDFRKKFVLEMKRQRRAARASGDIIEHARLKGLYTEYRKNLNFKNL